MNARLHVRQILCLVLCLLPLVLLGILVDAGFGELVTGVGMLAGAGGGELVGDFWGAWWARESATWSAWGLTSCSASKRVSS